MAQSLEKNIEAAKLSRSQAIMQKVNVLYSRDGSDAPPIESLKEKDEFNEKLFFGKSGDENIDWNSPGIEGIIRMYYEIIYKITGKVRNNIIFADYNDELSSDHNTTSRSSLQESAEALSNGIAFESGFFIGWEGLQSDISSSGGRTKTRLNKVLNMGRQGDFDVPMTEGWPALASALGRPNTSSTFTHNRDKVGGEWPEGVEDCVVFICDRIKELIGDERSPLGIKGYFDQKQTLQTLTDLGHIISDTVLGRRFIDVSPESTLVERYDYSNPDTKYSYGNGVYDSSEDLSQYNEVYGEDDGTYYEDEYGRDWRKFDNVLDGIEDYLDYWNPEISTLLNRLLELFTEIKQYINYTKIQDDTYLINPEIPPGKDVAWSMQNSWIDEIENAEEIISSFLEDLNQYYSGGETTSQAGRIYLNSRIDSFRAEIESVKNSVGGLGQAIDDNTSSSMYNIDSPIFGSVEDPKTLYGLRFMAVRMILDSIDGSKTAVESIGSAVAMMDKKIKKAEEELEMYGLDHDEWIYTPQVVGIEPHYRLNQATYEMEVAGVFVVFAGQDNCTAYDVERSLDYDPSSGSGSWTLLIPPGQTHSQESRDANTNKVLSYYLDDSIDPQLKPYYRVKAYDNGQGEKPLPEYSRVATESLWSDPRNTDDIEEPTYVAESPKKTYDPKEPVRVNAATSVPPNTLAWTTNWRGNEAEDVDRTIFSSEVPFDSIGSNLMVFVGERFKAPDKNGETNDYQLLDTYKIQFHDSIDSNEEVNLHVFIRSFSNDRKTENCIDVWFDSFDELPVNAVDGTIAYVRFDRKYYQWDGSVWSEIDDPCTEQTNFWKTPVNTYSQLPTIKNSDGDVRLVLDENIIYRWNGSLEEWVIMSGSSGTKYWASPVDTTDDLPNSADNGEIRFVIDEEALYRWNEGQEEWRKLSTGTIGGAAPAWGEPVPTFDDLPDPATQLNEIRLVVDEAKMYLWDAINGVWRAVYADAILAHDDLIDMPDQSGSVASHDGRYYTETEVDSFLDQINERVQHLEGLKPRDAQELSGDFSVTGTAFYSGYLSHSDLRFDTLSPEQHFNRIIKDASFILHNNNVEQFKDADKGQLKLYINDTEVDVFDLALHFDEEKREDGQTYTPAWGENQKIYITSITPYNNYPTYQRGDFEIHFEESDFVPGENKIQLTHIIGNEQRNSDELILFYDNNNSYRRFQSVSVQVEQLNTNKYLSGVRFISLGDELRLHFTVGRMFDNTYPFPKQVEINSNDFGVGSFEINHSSSGVTETISPASHGQYTYDKVYIVENEAYSSDPALIFTPYTVFGQDPEYRWSDSKILINSISQWSDDKNEYFVDEQYRLPIEDYPATPTLIGQWNSDQLLGGSDLQVFNGELIYPQHSYTYNLPGQDIDYRNYTGERHYCRGFYDVEPHNNGEFIIKGLDNENQNVNISIKLPGLTGWMDLKTPYNAATFSGADGDGCLMESGPGRYVFTTGEYSTANSGYVVLMRVTYSAPETWMMREISIKQISINW